MGSDRKRTGGRFGRRLRGRGAIGLRGAALSAALCIVSGAAFGADGACAPDRIEIRTADGVASFDVEVAATAPDRARGLMFRDEMARDAGMVFVYEDAAQVSFWMKNTPLPLDIIYISKRGVICSIAADTTPFSTDAIPSRCAAQTVLEVNAGVAAEAGLKVGAPVRHPSVARPVWPCE